MNTKNKAIQLPSQLGGLGDRLCVAASLCHEVPGAAEPNATGDRYFTDLQLTAEIGRAGAEQWFTDTFWPDDAGNIRCPRCAWSQPAALAEASAGQPYWCSRCRKNFSVKTNTVMSGSSLSLWQWVKLLHTWTGGIMPCSTKDLARRTGVDESAAHDVMRRILKATEQELQKLQEPAEMKTFKLSGTPRFRHKDKRGELAQSIPSVMAIAMVGRDSGRTFIETVSGPKGSEIRRFLQEHLVRGMDLYLSNTPANRTISWANTHFLESPESSYLLFHLRERTRTRLSTVHNWVSPENMAEYLTGFQWWENHRHLGHRERMRKLARGMMWKKPPPSATEKKRQKQTQKIRPNGGS